MHKIGLKLWNTNTDCYYKEAEKLYLDKVFDYIELYIVPGHLDLIDQWNKLPIKYDIHAPHSAHHMNLSINTFAGSNREKYNEVKEYADKLGADTIVMHGGANGNAVETANEIRDFRDVRIIIENKPYKHKNASESEFFVGSRVDEIMYIIKKSNCGFCLDIGHAVASANYQDIDPYDYIQEFLRLMPKRIHLSDIQIDSKFDEHLHIGHGTLNIKRLLSMLDESVPITIETVKDSKSNLYDFKEDVMLLKEIMEKNDK